MEEMAVVRVLHSHSRVLVSISHAETATLTQPIGSPHITCLSLDLKSVRACVAYY